MRIDEKAVLVRIKTTEDLQKFKTLCPRRPGSPEWDITAIQPCNFFVYVYANGFEYSFFRLNPDAEFITFEEWLLLKSLGVEYCPA